MEAFRTFIASSIYTLARFLDHNFYYFCTVGVLLAVFNYFFIKDYDKLLFKAAKDGKLQEAIDALANLAEVRLESTTYHIPPTTS
jgi:hypothetical protein